MRKTRIRNWKVWIRRILLILACVLAGYETAQAQFIYVNNETSPNTVSAFRMDSDGTLAPVPGSPFPTGGKGGRIRVFGVFSNATIHVKNDFLFACNTTSDTVSVFAINPDGSLTQVQGSPLETGGRFPIAVTTNPKGTLLFVSNYVTRDLSVFIMARNTEPSAPVLRPVPGSPFSLGSLRQPGGLAVDSTGTRLLIGGENMLGVYGVDRQGEVTAIDDPVETGWDTQALVITPDDRFVYAVGPEVDGLAGFRLSSQDQLTNLPRSPFPGSPGGSLFGLAVDPKGDLLVATRPGGLLGEAGLYLYRIGRNGSLTLRTGSPFSTAGSELQPIGIDPDGVFVVAADVVNQTIHVLRIESRALTEIASSPFDLGSSGARPSGIAIK